MENIDKSRELINMGITLMSCNKYHEALEYFEKARNEDKNNPELYSHIGNAYVNLKLYDDAIKSFSMLLMIEEYKGKAYFNIGNVNYIKRDLKNAIKNYYKAEKSGFHPTKMYEIMSEIFKEIKDNEQSQIMISKALNQEPLRGDLWRKKILIEIQLGHIEKALYDLDEFLDLLPDSFDVYELRAKIFCEMERFEDALECIKKGLERFPKDIKLLLLDIHVKINAKQYEAAQKAIIKIKEIGLSGGNRVALASEEARILCVEEKKDELISCLNWALEESPNNSTFLFMLLNLYGSSNDKKVIEISERIFGIEDIDISVKCMARLYHADSMENLGKHDEAQEEYKKITKDFRRITVENANLIDVYIYRLLAHNALNEFDKAFELADYLEKVSSNPADGFAYRSLIYKRMGEEKRAEEEICKARKVNSDY